jgi:hypothetical protein
VTTIEGGLITLEYALEGLKYTGSSATRDADITAYVKAATPLIEHMTGRLLPESKTRRFDGGKSALLLTDHLANAAAVTQVTEDETVIADYVVDAEARIIYAGTRTAPRRFEYGIQNVAVTYTTGYMEIPQALQLAARELVRHMVQVGNQAGRMGPLANANPGENNAVRMGFILPERVIELCAPFRQGGFA